MADTVLSTFRTRVELFAVEIQEEKSWLLSTLLWAAAVVFFSGLAIIFVVGMVVYLVPDVARPWVVGAFALIFVCLSIYAVVGLRRSMRDKPPPMSNTIGELKKDIDWIRSRD
jgi:uncharacterized membrane protein YqjE